ncbi:S-DNA-T family DNA segregation ATPase FtsK/SpoIIIE [Streptococcus rupicaprae]|uniref:S-DNA-T family DNA segregation ATPase FtsK/SpoIIIE n=1 Tax=Streptococcus rupicaprae TaxID=759619 RepID=A0ABV2FH65_9STRE
MTKELILYTAAYRYDWTLQPGQSLEIAQEGTADLVLPSLTAERLRLELGDNGVLVVSVNGSPYEALEDGRYTLAGLQAFIGQDLPRQVYASLLHDQISLGSGQHHTVVLDGLSGQEEVVLVKAKGQWSLVSVGQPVYVNNCRVIAYPVLLEKGDEVSFDRVTIKLFDREVWVKGVASRSDQLVAKDLSDYRFYEDYPDYHRSPRIIYREPEDKVTLRGPVETPRKPANQLVKAIVPPLVMVAMTITLSFFQSRGIYIYIMVVSSLVSMIFSVTGYFKSQKEYRESLVEREELFRDYLFDKAQDLYQLQEKQRQGQLYHYPSVQELEAMASNYHHRIYEKTPQQFDFLSYRLGLGKRKASFSLSYAPLDKDKKLDDLEREGLALYDQYKRTHDLPIVTDLVSGPVGYIGPRPVVLEQLQLLVHQLSFFHSYHDLQFITLVPEEEKDLWSWMRWLPHATLQDINVRGLVYNQRSRDQVLNSLYQVLKVRKAQLNDRQSRSSTLFTPHFVVLITDQSLVMDHVIMEFFQEDPTGLGCSVIFVEDTLSSLSENIRTIIDIKDRNQGVLTLEKGELIDKVFALDHFGEGFDKESLPRLLAPLNHLQNLKNAIPESVNFLEMYEVEEVKDLRIMERWGQHAPHKSLAVPLGLRGKEDIVQLDLHEKAHGPHGLVAGTTGSGKSEILQSYILSLAINFHPHDVAFLLIDYKGGGMANLFKDLPHLLGSITNLDATQSMRALISINAELKRRQRLFSQYDVNHINQYQKKYKNGEAAEPMPHLFLISDEFAELKTNEPEFMKELVSTARIGRSLGIHLILATQKPTGVVDDQIWSNSRFKLALKMADRQDSQEMLKTPDAADITQAGRAYLQVGNNEIYELFQSAYSGADYQPDKDKLHIEDHTIYAINDNGQYQILTEDLSGLEEADSIQQIPSELAVIVDEIKAITEAHGIAPLPRPWLPPLKERVYLEELGMVKNDLETSSQEMEATLGLVDLPSRQTQETITHNFTKDGHLALFSQPAMGKSTFIQTIVMDLVRKYTPEHVQFYLFDFATNGLLALRDLPHVADYFLLEDDEKLTKFILRIKKEIEHRKKVFSRNGVASLEMYHQVSDLKLAHLMIMIDGYDGVKEATMHEDLEQVFQTIAREGESLGISIVVTASRTSALKAALYTNIKRRMAFKMTEIAEPSLIVGRSRHHLEDIPGRGLTVYKGSPEIFQVALPVRGETGYDITACLKDEVAKINLNWEGPKPLPIPIVPEQLSFEEFEAKASVQRALSMKRLPLGLDFLDVESVSLPLKDFRHLLYTSDNEKHHKVLSHHMIRTVLQLEQDYRIMLIDPDGVFEAYQQAVFTYISQPKTLETITHQLIQLLDARKDGKETIIPFMIVIPDLEQFERSSDVTGEQLVRLYREGWQFGLNFVVGGIHGYLNNNLSSSLAKQLRNQNQYYLIGLRMTDQGLVEKSYNSKEPYLQQDEAYLYQRSGSIKLKVSRHRLQEEEE